MIGLEENLSVINTKSKAAWKSVTSIGCKPAGNKNSSSATFELKDFGAGDF